MEVEFMPLEKFRLLVKMLPKDFTFGDLKKALQKNKDCN